MILRTHQIPKNVSTQNSFQHRGPNREPPNFSYMPNTKKYFLINHFLGKCFPTKIFLDEDIFRRVPSGSWTSPSQVLVGSWAGPNQVSSKIQGSPRQVLVALRQVRSGPRWVLVRSRAGLGEVPMGFQSSPSASLGQDRASPGQVSARSHAGLSQVSTRSWAGLVGSQRGLGWVSIKF